MSAARLIANYLRLARQDLDGALILKQNNNNRNAIYLCEQAAEKIIIAILTSEHQRANREHKLDDMVSLIPADNPLIDRLREIESLAAYATTYRYPTSAGRIADTPPDRTFDDYAEKVNAILEQVVSAFGVDMSQRDSPASKPQPIR